jgi:hypothetical protein
MGGDEQPGWLSKEGRLRISDICWGVRAALPLLLCGDLARPGDRPPPASLLTDRGNNRPPGQPSSSRLVCSGEIKPGLQAGTSQMSSWLSGRLKVAGEVGVAASSGI